ncbi:hypothetical protein MNBD_GAMMA07-2336 [hydrothermal vent metagenome]|uniref:PNPLA domain-containing protein n=1 Tax=hydrothermal vent metagenome TaxID=652676 RepID=A0A3B0WN96_9ZZZZ
MNYNVKNLSEHLRRNGKPKRILTLDGGGIRGILSIGILQKIEDTLREQHNADDSFRLCHYFDLIVGTSTGSIIAAALAQGMTVESLRKIYMDIGKKIFKKSLLRKGLIRAKYDEDKLADALKNIYGADTTLSSDSLKTGLLIITKRLDTGSPWPISNNPDGQYYTTKPNNTIGNSEYPLWQVVRASTAAPAFFDPETITIADKPGYEPITGNFIDGGVSPYNNPSLMALMYSTMEGYKIGWPTGADNILLVSVGTGSSNANVTHSDISAKHAVNALLSVVDDCEVLQETILQWMSSSPTAKTIGRELGNLQNDLITDTPLLSYLRYNINLNEQSIQKTGIDLPDEEQIKSLGEIDAPENMDTLHKLGVLLAEQDVKSKDFPLNFKL